MFSSFDSSDKSSMCDLYYVRQYPISILETGNARVKRLIVDLEVSLICVQHTVHPGKEFLGAMIGVQYNRAILGQSPVCCMGSRSDTGEGRDIHSV